MVTVTSVNSLLDILYKGELLLDFHLEILGILDKFKSYIFSFCFVGNGIVVKLFQGGGDSS